MKDIIADSRPRTLAGINRTPLWFQQWVLELELASPSGKQEVIDRVEAQGAPWDQTPSQTEEPHNSPDGELILTGRLSGLNWWYRLTKNGEELSPENCPLMWASVTGATSPDFHFIP